MSIVPLHIPINEIDKYFYNRKEDIKKIEYYLNSLELGISQSLQETVLAHFDEIDANNDGRVTNAEIQSYNIQSDLDKQRIEDINRSVNRMSLFTEGLTEYEGSIMDYRYATDSDDDEV